MTTRKHFTAESVTKFGSYERDLLEAFNRGNFNNTVRRILNAGPRPEVHDLIAKLRAAWPAWDGARKQRLWCDAAFVRALITEIRGAGAWDDEA